MNSYLLDTNIVSLVLRRNQAVEQKLELVLSANDSVVLSPIVWYELMRGLLTRDAKNQQTFLAGLLLRFDYRDLDREDWQVAARLWAERSRMGRPIADADLLIAVQAKRLSAILVTDNEKDFEGLGVKTENWRRAPV